MIHLNPDVEVKLHAWSILTNGLEFSGLGLVEREGQDFRIVHVDVLGVGSSGYTEINPDRQRRLPMDDRRKLWFHKHPINNWSARDEKTITEEPLGGIPQLVQWSVSIVLTPDGWIGRVDLYVPRHRSFEMKVSPKVPTPETIEAAKKYITEEMIVELGVMKKEFGAIYHKSKAAPGHYEDPDYYDLMCELDGMTREELHLYGMDDDMIQQMQLAGFEVSEVSEERAMHLAMICEDLTEEELLEDGWTLQEIEYVHENFDVKPKRGFYGSHKTFRDIPGSILV